MPNPIDSPKKLPICLGCGETSSKLFFSGQDRMQGLPGEYQLWKCDHCQTVFLHPVPEHIESLYPEDYQPYSVSKPQGKLATWLYARGLAKQTRLVRAMTGLQGGTALDVGCAHGDFLATLRAKGWKVTGLETNAKIAQEGQADHGLEMIIDRFETAPLPQQAFDLVTFWDVLEHLSDPRLALKKAWEITRPGGWIMLSLPNPDSWEAGWFGTDWAGWDIPRHLWVFKLATIKNLLQAEGWEYRSHQTRRGRFFLLNLSLSYWVNHYHDGQPAWKAALRLANTLLGRTLLWPYFEFVEAIGRGSILICAAQRMPTTRPS